MKISETEAKPELEMVLTGGMAVTAFEKSCAGNNSGDPIFFRTIRIACRNAGIDQNINTCDHDGTQTIKSGELNTAALNCSVVTRSCLDLRSNKHVNWCRCHHSRWRRWAIFGLLLLTGWLLAKWGPRLWTYTVKSPFRPWCFTFALWASSRHLERA